MKSIILTFVIVILLIPIGHGIEITSEAEVAQFFTCLRNIFRRGIPLMMGPSDPFEMEDYSRQLQPNDTGHWLAGLFNFNYIKFTGLSKFSVRSVAATHMDDEDTFLFNTKMAFNLRLTGLYNVSNGVYMDIAKFKGQGSLIFRTSPVEVDLSFYFKENCTKLTDGFKNAHISIKIKSIVNITGLEPNERMSSLVSRQLSEMIDDLFNHNAEMVEEYFDKILNDFLHSFALSNLPWFLRPLVQLYFYFVWRSCITQYYALEDLLQKIWNW